jgi:DNA-binding MarR family transcriptional regulator
MIKGSNPKNYERRAKVGRLLNQVQIRFVDVLDKALSPFDITAAQYVIVSMLASGRAGTATQLCKELSYNPGAMTRMLDRLEQKNILRRKPDPDSRRTFKVELTAHGRALFPDLFASSERVIEQVFGAFTPNELDQFEVHLNRMLSKI